MSMNRENTDVAHLRQARRRLERMQGRLLNPNFQSLEDCASDLASAAGLIRKLDSQSAVWKGIDRAALEGEVTGLRRTVDGVEALLANAGRFYAGCIHILSGDQAPPNYTPGGSLALSPGQDSAETTRLVMHG
jgi:hypothetical protein